MYAHLYQVVGGEYSNLTKWPMAFKFFRHHFNKTVKLAEYLVTS